MLLKQEETETKGRFFIVEDHYKCAEITYSIAGKNLIIIDHTEVNENFAGKGYGKMLVEAVIEKAEKEKIKILPLCPFANAFFKKHPEYHHLLK